MIFDRLTDIPSIDRVIRIADFRSISGCRDPLFHVHDQFTLPARRERTCSRIRSPAYTQLRLRLTPINSDHIAAISSSCKPNITTASSAAASRTRPMGGRVWCLAGLDQQFSSGSPTRHLLLVLRSQVCATTRLVACGNTQRHWRRQVPKEFARDGEISCDFCALVANARIGYVKDINLSSIVAVRPHSPEL